ncbi:MAG: ribosomal protein [Nocardioidaceae bacterium]|nr:ribosomal protein [Nocardioidaceae bacterium]
MANIKSQIKRNLQSAAAHERNKSVRSALKTSIRRFNEAVASGSDDAKALAREASRKLDKAATSKVIHKNQAANKKAAIAKKANAL